MAEDRQTMPEAPSGEIDGEDSNPTPAFEPSVASTPRVGDVVDGRYEILSVLGVGGFGVVYKARQLNTDQLVALKVLLADRAHETPEAIVTARERFKREMKVVGELRHRNIVKLIDSGHLQSGLLYMVLEFIDGQELSELIREHRERGETMSPNEVKRLMGQVLAALATAHERGYIHRDLKPQNIMVTRGGLQSDAVVLDFGIAGITEPSRGQDYMQLTKTRQSVGTVSYMAPEQLMGKKTPLTDIYAWGLIFLECLTGHTIVVAETPYAAVLIHASPEPIPIPDAIASHPLGRVLARATAKNVKDRYQSVKELYQALEDCSVTDLKVPWTTREQNYQGLLTDSLQHLSSPITGRDHTSTAERVLAQKPNRALWAAVVLVVLVVAAVFWALSSQDSKTEKPTEAVKETTALEPVADVATAHLPELPVVVKAPNTGSATAGAPDANVAEVGAVDLLAVDTAPVIPEKTDEEHFAELAQSGAAGLRNKDFEQAIAAFEACLDLKEDKQVRASLAFAYENSGRPCDAMIQFRELAKDRSDANSATWLNKAIELKSANSCD